MKKSFRAVDIGLGLEIRSNGSLELEPKKGIAWKYWLGILLGAPIAVVFLYAILVMAFSQPDGFYP